MHFKPLAHLARISFAKGVVHAYTPGAVVAGQQGLGTLHTYPVNKLAKATQLQNAFSSSSGSGAGAGSKAGHTSTNANGADGSLASYFAAWSHAEQTGDDTEFKKHQNARRIAWKQSDKNATSKNAPRLDIKPADILRQSTRLSSSRTYSENAAQDVRRSEEEELIEAEALARIDEAIAQEIRSVKESAKLDAAAAVEAEAVRSEDESVQSVASPKSTETSATQVSSPVSDESSLRSEEIVSLGDQAQYADIPFRFQSMVKDGLVPNVHAYNYIIQSAINLAHGYQPFPRAVEVFNDMTNKGVQPNEETYRILISFLTSQSVLASNAQKEIDQHNLRFGYGQGSFMFTSMEHKRELFADDVSIQIATKLYNIARRTLPDFKLNDGEYTSLVAAYEKSGSPASLIATVTDMQSQNVAISADAYVSAIEACAETEDVSTAKWLYAQYRQLAIDRNTSDLFDSKVYVALIKAYYNTGSQQDGLHFFEKVIQSFQGAPNESLLAQHLTDTFVVDGLVDLYTANGDLHSALESVGAYGISEKARAVAINKILTSAADRNEREVIDATFKDVDASIISADSFMAVAAMHFRHGEITEAKAVWARCQHAPSASFATMYALSVIGTGKIEQGLLDVVGLFRQLRSSAREQSQPVNASEIDESILLLGQALAHGNTIYSSQAAVTLFRLMIENGGLVPFIAQAAIARVGPECVHQLSDQDIALALHVQAYMLPATASLNNDVAQPARFSHLLETVLDRQIGMDPSTVHAVDTALPKLNGARPDLERRWNAWRRPAQVETSPVVVSPTVPRSPMAEQALYDPYSHTTDHRASRAISELLESTSGRLENHISEAMSRLRNVRRMGRHLQYSAYAKLITAAGKARQSRLLHELLAMAQTDVPLNLQIPAVRNGWVTIYDSMISACLSVGERQLASKFHEEILSMGAAPSANTFGIYITTLEGTFDEATEAVKIFQRAMSEGVQPTVFLFNAVIGKLGKARRIDDCLQYFGQMQNLGIRPSSVTYGTLVNALCRTSEESFAVEMFDEMEAAPNYRPRPAPYNSIIQYFLNTKRDRAKVLQYYGRMRSQNIKPTSHTYKLLIESYATLEPINLTAAETVLQDMKANGVAPEAVHYGSLIHAKGCVLSDLAGARAIFDSVLADPSIKPTDNLYQNFLEAMVANHEISNTEEVLKDMSSRGIAMTPYIANTLIHGWSGAGEIHKAKAVYDSLGSDKREPSTYEHMTRAFIAAGDHDGANAVVREMLQKGYPAAVTDKVLGLVGSPAA